MVNLETFKGRIKTPVRLATRKFEGKKSTREEQRAYGYGEYSLGPKEFSSDLIIITNAFIQGSGDRRFVNLHYFDSKTKSIQYAYLPVDFQVEEVRNVESRILMNEYNEFLLKDIKNQLGHSCWIGSDPEIFVVDEKDQMIPAFLFLGSKKEPTMVQGKEKSRWNLPIYWDGFQAEFETQPQSCLAYHSDSIRAQLNNLLIAARKYNDKAKLSVKTTFDISSELMASSKEEHVQFGCMPSFNVYGMNGVSKEGRDVPFRSAGGHIHFGFNTNGDKNFKMDEKQVVRMVKALDAIIGVACVSLFATFDDPRRREMYGLAGEYRLPIHGLEYRTLSNAWLCHPLITNIVFDVARKAMMFGDKGLLQTWKCEEKETIRIIQECDVLSARKVLETNKDLFIGIIAAAYDRSTNVYDGEKTYTHAAPMVYDIFLNGVESAVADPHNMVDNWRLDGSKQGTWVDHCNAPGKNVVSSKKIILLDKKKVV